MQRSALCRSRRELSNAYLLAKIGVDTAENEPLEVWGQNSIQYSLHSLGSPHPALRELERHGYTGGVLRSSTSAMAELDRQEEDALGEMARFALDRAENMRSSIKKHQYMMRLAFIFQKFVASCRKYV